MNKFSNVIYKLHKIKEDGSGKDSKAKYYNLLTTNLSALQGLLKEYGSKEKGVKANFGTLQNVGLCVNMDKSLNER